MSLSSRMFAAALAAFCSVGAAQAASGPQISVKPKTRIVEKIDNAKVVTVANSHPAKLAGLADLGRVGTNTQFKHILLVLKSSDEQEFALHALLDQQQDKTSPNYHQWMMPDTFGASFGVSSTDLEQVKSWLQAGGFTINAVAKSGRVIDFGGTSAQIESAFHTEMHQYTVNGETRVSNSTDIAIPAALAAVVAGPAALNNFPRHSDIVNRSKAVVGQDGKFHEVTANGVTPDYTSVTSSKHYVGAADLATIFNTTPLLNAGVNGKGVTVGILGQTDILLADVQIYRQLFNLPKNDPTFTLIGDDPGTIADDGESDLDVELSGGIAPGASINFIYAGNGAFGGGIDSAAEYAVENNSVDIISLSYGECEASLGAGGNAFYDVVWEQAASQGQTVFVSAGDSGPATCDSSSAAYATHGYAVNGLGSTPFNVSVGGTMFNDGTALGTTPYWGPAAGAPYSTALSYIPEIPWNESYFDPYGSTSGFGGIVSGGGGISLYYGTPAWQTGPGVPTTDPSGIVTAPVVAGPHRYMPDVSLQAAGVHDATIYCSEASCQLNSDGTVAGIGAVGGTSVAAPSMAGVQALIDQKNGGRQGLANYFYYRVAALQSTTACNSATYTTTSTTACGFHDVQSGNTKIPTNAADTTSIELDAAAGFDLAVGLGSPDVTNLANAWSKVTFTATTTTFTLTPTTSAFGATYNVALKVAPTTGSGTPTGDVSIIAQALNGGVGFYTLSGGQASGTLTGLPAGTYNVYAHYAGDTTFGGSNSASIQVKVGTDTTTTVAGSYLLGTNGSFGATSTFTYGTNVFIEAGVQPASGVGTPTGKMTFKLTNGTNALTPFVANLDPNGGTVGATSFPAAAYFDAGLGLAAYDIAPTYALLPPGTYSATVTYAGDSSFAGSTSTAINFTVGVAATTLTLRAVSAEVPSGGTATLNATVTTLAAAAGGVPATGTVTFMDTTTGAALGTGTLVNGAVTITTNAITANGANTISAAYAGDTNYGAKTATATVTVGGAASTLTLTSSVTAAKVLSAVVLTATAPSTATGTVYFYDSSVLLGTATLSTSTHVATLSLVTLTAGTHNITATYAGNTTLDSSTSNVVPVVISQNTPALQLTMQAQNSTTATVAMNATLKLSPLNLNAAATAYVAASPAPTGAITFNDGSTPLGSISAVYLPGGYGNYVASYTTTSLKPGVHNISAAYPGDANYAASTSNTQAINIGLTTTTITSTASLVGGVPTVGTGTPFSLMANIAAVLPNTPAIGGTVSFYDGTTLIGTATVTNGVATLTTASLNGVGTHLVTGVYSGDGNYYTSKSTNTLSIVAVTPGFNLTVNPNSLTVTRGSIATTTVTATSFGNYNATATFACSGLPSGAFCVFIPQSVTFAGGNTTVTSALTIGAIPPSSKSAGFSNLLWIPAVFFAGMLLFRRRQFSARGRQLLLLALLACGLMTVSGCGGTPYAGTPVGTSTITVSAAAVGAASGSGNTQASTPLTLIVQ